MRVWSVRLFVSAGPGYGEPIDEHLRLEIGDVFVVLSALVDGAQSTSSSSSSTATATAAGIPAAMFETVSARPIAQPVAR